MVASTKAPTSCSREGHDLGAVAAYNGGPAVQHVQAGPRAVRRRSAADRVEHPRLAQSHRLLGGQLLGSYLEQTVNLGTMTSDDCYPLLSRYLPTPRRGCPC